MTCMCRSLTLGCAHVWPQVIEMCEDYSGERAKVTTVPTWLLKATRNILKSMDWSRDAADRLVGAASWALAAWILRPDMHHMCAKIEAAAVALGWLDVGWGSCEQRISQCRIQAGSWVAQTAPCKSF